MLPSLTGGSSLHAESHPAMQATVQATLANLPMDQVQSTYSKSDPAYADNLRWAEDALVTAVFCIIICGAWGTLSIRYLSPFLLEKASTSGQTQSLSSSCMTEASVSKQIGSLSSSCRGASTLGLQMQQQQGKHAQISYQPAAACLTFQHQAPNYCQRAPSQLLAAGPRGR